MNANVMDWLEKFYLPVDMFLGMLTKIIRHVLILMNWKYNHMVHVEDFFGRVGLI